MSDIERVLKIDRELRPNLYARTEDIARIIDPGAFVMLLEGYSTVPSPLAITHQVYGQAVAYQKAAAVLEYLGVNTRADWWAIMTRLSTRGPASTIRCEDFCTCSECCR